MTTVKYYPTEAQEQEELARWLDRHGVLWCHVPNGGNRSAVTGAQLKKQGVKKGVPDVIIFRGMVAIELKRQCGGVTSPEQRKWLEDLTEAGWTCYVCRGAKAAIDVLTNLGYADGTR